jgi:hypothetical protein
MKATYSPSKPAYKVPLCKNCVNYKPILFQNRGICTLGGDIDVVTGKRNVISADKARLSFCGEEAKYHASGPNQVPMIVCDIDMSNPGGIILLSWVVFYIAFLESLQATRQ